MCFVLEHHQPFFIATVHNGIHDDATGVVFLRFFQIIEFAGFFQQLHPNGRQIHQAHFTRRFPVQLAPGFQIRLIRNPDGRSETAIIDTDLIHRCQKRGMPAMIRPIRVNHFDFRQRRLPFFRVPEISLTKFQVGLAHRQPQLGDEFFPARFIQFAKPFYYRHVRRNLHIHSQSIRFHQRSFSGLHRIDAVGFHCFELTVRNIAIQCHHFGGYDLRSIFLRDDLDALRGPISPLVILPWQILHGKHSGVRTQIDRLVENVIGRWFGEYRIARQNIFIIVNSRHVIPVDEP